MRWRQDAISHELIPIDEAAAKRDGHFISRDFEPFISPIDKTIVSGRKQYDEHCKRHGVVNAAEFDKAFYAQKAKERADHYEGRSSRAETQARRENINEIIGFLERTNG